MRYFTNFPYLTVVIEARVLKVAESRSVVASTGKLYPMKRYRAVQ